MTNRISARHKKLIKYTIVGGSSAFLEFSIFYLLSKYLGVYYLSANIFAVSFAILYGFFLQKYWTFRNYEKKSVTQFVKWLIMAGLSFALNNFLVWFFVSIFQTPLGVAKILQLAITYVFNFSLQNYFVFKPSDL